MKSYSLPVIILFFIASSVTAQTTVSIAAAADNTIYQTPAGSSNALGQNIFSGTNGGGSPRRGLIKFNVAAVVPSNAVITSVTLTLNCNLSRSIPDNASLHKLLANWGEGTSNAGSVSDGSGAAATTNDATWTTSFFPGTLWTNTGGDYAATASASITINSTGFYQWNTPGMVTDVQSWLTAPASNFGWILICDETVASTARKFGSRENATVANRPSLSITYSTVLPVTLSYFKASANDKAVMLHWETSQEINNHYFEILHSTDGILFASVGRLAGHGTSSIKHEYKFTHNTYVPGNHLYKLAQVDFDGKRKHSPVERVFIPAITGNTYVFPNPVLNEFRVVPNSGLQNATYKIFNQNGAVLLSGVLSAGNIKADALLPGTYYMLLYIKKELVNQLMFIKM